MMVILKRRQIVADPAVVKAAPPPFLRAVPRCKLASGFCEKVHHRPPNRQEDTMQTIQDVMTREVQSISPQETIQRAAQMMDELNVGAIPVLDDHKLVGMITDRDITVRATAAGQAPGSTRVGDIMSTDVRTCSPNQTVDEVLGQMGDVQIRRVPVVDQDTQEVVGIVSMGDMATKHSAGVDRALEEVSTPSTPDLSSVQSETRH
jgi:CBS-domain-containing membrane protein